MILSVPAPLLEIVFNSHLMGSAFSLRQEKFGPWQRFHTFVTQSALRSLNLRSRSAHSAMPSGPAERKFNVRAMRAQPSLVGPLDDTSGERFVDIYTDHGGSRLTVDYGPYPRYRLVES